MYHVRRPNSRSGDLAARTEFGKTTRLKSKEELSLQAELDFMREAATPAWRNLANSRWFQAVGGGRTLGFDHGKVNGNGMARWVPLLLSATPRDENGKNSLSSE